jgi:hypothetical protein
VIARALSFLQPFRAPVVREPVEEQHPFAKLSPAWAAADRAEKAEPLQPRRVAKHRAVKAAVVRSALERGQVAR